MSEFMISKKVFVKSKNSTYKINRRYIYSLLAIMILTILINYLFNYKPYAIALTKSIFISLVFTSILTYLSHLLKKEYNPVKVFTDSNAIIVSLIIGYFGVDLPIYILFIANIISVFITILYKKINTSASLYGLLFMIVYSYFNGINDIEHLKYIESILTIISFGYLFYKKSIKYNIVIAYILTIFSILFLYTILSGSSASFLLTKLTANALFLLSIYTLTDYQVTPTIGEANIVYGISIGLITAILIFIYPNISIVVPIIIGHLLLTRILEHISPKLKYNYKMYYVILTICLILVILTIISLLIFWK